MTKTVMGCMPYCYAKKGSTKKMASIYRQNAKPFWFCSYSTWSAENSKWQRHFKSTKMADKKAAAEVCRAWEQAAKVGRAGKLMPEKAREVVARGVADIFTAVNS